MSCALTAPLRSRPQTDVLLQLTMPYWLEDDSNKSAKVKLAGVVALTLGTTGVRCDPMVQHISTSLGMAATGFTP